MTSHNTTKRTRLACVIALAYASHAAGMEMVTLSTGEKVPKPILDSTTLQLKTCKTENPLLYDAMVASVLRDEFILPDTINRGIQRYIQSWQPDKGPHEAIAAIIRAMDAEEEATLKGSMRKAMATLQQLPNCDIPTEHRAVADQLLATWSATGNQQPIERLSAILNTAQEKDRQS